MNDKLHTSLTVTSMTNIIALVLAAGKEALAIVITSWNLLSATLSLPSN